MAPQSNNGNNAHNLPAHPVPEAFKPLGLALKDALDRTAQATQKQREIAAGKPDPHEVFDAAKSVMLGAEHVMEHAVQCINDIIANKKPGE